MSRPTHTIVRRPDRIDMIPTQSHTATLVWMHGLGDSADGFLPCFSDPEFVYPSLKIVLPTASRMPVTINHGDVMNSWYDIPSCWDTNIHPTALQSADRICAILSEEAQSTSRLFLGGFSQGGAMALLTGYGRYRGELKGVIAASSYTMQMEVEEGRKRIPGLIYHGDRDEVIDVTFAKSTYDRTLEGVNYMYRLVRGLGHSVDRDEMVFIKGWIKAKDR